MKNIDPLAIWFFTGSRHLIGEGPLAQVCAHSQAIVDGRNATGGTPLRLLFKPVLKNPEVIRLLRLDANRSSELAGLVL